MKHKLLAVLLALIAALCLCFGLAACGESSDNNSNNNSNNSSNSDNNGNNNENDGHEHIFTVENKCSVCGKEWEYTKSDALEYTKVVLDGVAGYDVRFGEYEYREVTKDPQTGFPIVGDPIIIGKEIEAEEVVFPYGYNGLPVISIGRFYPCMSDTVKSITVPKSILSFGQGLVSISGSTRGAFQCSALEKLDLPDGLPVYTRQDIPFDDRSAANTAFPLCFETLFYGIGAFTPEICPLYEDPQYRENGALYIGNYLFDTAFEKPVDTYTVKDGTKVVISLHGAKHVTVPDSVEIIAQGAFRDSRSLESIEVGSGIEEIGDNAFWYSSLTSITLPDKPIYIGSHAFHDTPFFEDQANWEYPDGESAENYTSRSLYVGNHLIYVVGRDTFSRSFEIKPNLKSIACGACEFCVFGELRIPSIEAWFNVRRGGNGAVPTIEKKWTIGGQEVTEVDVPSSVKEIPAYAFASSPLTHINIPASVTKIGEGAFMWCSSLTNISLPAGVTSIGDYAFYDCSSLTNISLPAGVTSIGDYAFYDCSSLTSISIPNNMISIGNYAFQDCHSLTSIEIPDSVTSIGGNAFTNCGLLESVTIGSGVAAIGSYAFMNSGVRNIYFDGTIEKWKEIKDDSEVPDHVTVHCSNGDCDFNGNSI